MSAQGGGPAIPGVVLPTIYETGVSPFAPQHASVKTATSNAGIDATIDLDGVTFTQVPGTNFATDASGTATLSTSAKYADGSDVPGETGAGSSFLGAATFTPPPGGTANTGDYFQVIRNEGDDFFFVRHQNGSQNPQTELADIGIYYGGTFASAATIDAKTGSATYSKDDGATVFITTGSTLASGGDSSSTYDESDVTLTANFNTDTVSGRITLGGGADAAPGDLLLEGATISGADFSGGTVRVVNVGTNTTATGASLSRSGFVGSFMGADGDVAAGVLQASGTLNDLDDGIGAENAIITGHFSADEN